MPGTIPVTPTDLFEVSWQGGGGSGDPLLRDRGPRRPLPG